MRARAWVKAASERSNCKKCAPVPRATAGKQPFPERDAWVQPGPQVDIYTPSTTEDGFHWDPGARGKGLFQCSSQLLLYLLCFNQCTNRWWFAKCHGNPRAHSEIICQYFFYFRIFV